MPQPRTSTSGFCLTISRGTIVLRFAYGSVRLPFMLSPDDIQRIRTDLAELETAREQCTDSGIQRLIDDWILEAKEKLAQAQRRFLLCK